jgi:Ca2+-binding EF-hand superfamily protein
MSSGKTAQAPSSSSSTSSGADVTLKSLDTNKDGAVSKSEAAAAPDIAKEFSKLDKNHDGKLDETEFSKHKSSTSTTK